MTCHDNWIWMNLVFQKEASREPGTKARPQQHPNCFTIPRSNQPSKLVPALESRTNQHLPNWPWHQQTWIQNRKTATFESRKILRAPIFVNVLSFQFVLQTPFCYATFHTPGATLAASPLANSFLASAALKHWCHASPMPLLSPTCLNPHSITAASRKPRLFHGRSTFAPSWQVIMPRVGKPIQLASKHRIPPQCPLPFASDPPPFRHTPRLLGAGFWRIYWRQQLGQEIGWSCCNPGQEVSIMCERRSARSNGILSSTAPTTPTSPAACTAAINIPIETPINTVVDTCLYKPPHKGRFQVFTRRC